MRRTCMSLLVAVAAAGCAHGTKPQTPSTPPPASRPVPRIALHWNDAADTTRTLHGPSDKPFRAELTLTGLADTLQGFHIQFRLEPTTTVKGMAWRFADSLGCLAAVWSATAEADKHAPAPWPHKLLITDARPLEDGSVALVVAGAFDGTLVHPDSVYSLCHMDFVPPEPASAGASCAGWDAPMRIYVENATILIAIEQPVFEVGKAIFFEPLRAEGAKDSAGRR